MGRVLEFKADGPIPEIHGHGFQVVKVESKDQRRVGQFGKDRFTFSQLKPYSNWKELHDEAIKLWEYYVSATDPEAITRRSVRYLNHISLEVGADLDQYLTAGPRLPAPLPQQLSHFLINLVVPDDDSAALINITQTADREIEDRLRILLDIEAFENVEMNPRDNAMSVILHRLRAGVCDDTS